jgi:hypothetical protein
MTNLEINLWTRKKLIIFCALLLIPLVILEIWSANRLATYGGKISSLGDIKSNLILENQVLENQIADKSSLLEVNQKARDLGLVTAHQTIYLQPQSLALSH